MMHLCGSRPNARSPPSIDEPLATCFSRPSLALSRQKGEAKFQPACIKVTTPIRQQQILFVDDEKNFLDSIRALFTAWSKNTWRIEVAVSADQALEILKTRPFDLIVVDVNMPVLDGVQFLNVLTRRYPDLKKAALTGLATEEKRSACLASGVELFIEKPRSAEGFKSVFAMLDELITWKPQTGFQGMLRRVGLQDVIQMECLGRNSSLLEIKDRTVSGRIYIEDGRIIHAVVGDKTGEAAFQKLLLLAAGAFQLQPFEPPPQRTIEGQWEFLLMEAARVRDESTALTPEPAAESAQRDETPPPDGPSSHLMETLICSGQGRPLYQWKCYDTNSRVELLKKISQYAARLGRLLPLGKFDRLEIQLHDSRIVAQATPDRMVFVQVAVENEKIPA
jgi:CheY-like chemotaxis protein